MIPCYEIGTRSKTEIHSLNELSHLKRAFKNSVRNYCTNWQTEHIPNDWKSVSTHPLL